MNTFLLFRFLNVWTNFNSASEIPVPNPWSTIELNGFSTKIILRGQLIEASPRVREPLSILVFCSKMNQASPNPWYVLNVSFFRWLLERGQSASLDESTSYTLAEAVSSHVAVMDKKDVYVSVVTSLNTWFGSKVKLFCFQWRHLQSLVFTLYILT